METYDKTFEELYNIIQCIDDDCLYVVKLSLRHVCNYNRTNRSYITRCIHPVSKHTKDSLKDHKGGYHHTELKVLYYNTKNNLVRIDESFTVEEYGSEKDNEINKYIKKIVNTKNINQIIESIQKSSCYPLDGSVIKSRMSRHLELCNTLENFKNFIIKYCNTSGKRLIQSIEDLTAKNSISVVKGDDYVHISIPIVSYNYTRDEMINIIKKFRTEFDNEVLKRISSFQKIDKKSLKLNHLVYTEDSRLIYTISFKNI